MECSLPAVAEDQRDREPEILLPGRELKVGSRPFRADVDLQAREPTSFLGRLVCRSVSHHVG